jgi:hypothetical protein
MASPERFHAQSIDQTLFPTVVRAVRRPGRRALTERPRSRSCRPYRPWSAPPYP